MAISIDELIGLDGFSQPAFLPDGSALLCIGPGDGLMQAWVQPLGSGAARRISFVENERVMSARLSPDGAQAILSVDAGGDEHAQLWLVPIAGGEAKQLTNAPKVIHTFGTWTPNGKAIYYAANSRDRARFDLHRMDLASGKVETLLKEGQTLSTGGIQPNGTLLPVIEDLSHVNTGISLLDLRSGERKPIKLAERTARAMAFRWNKDGSALYFAADGERDFLGIGRYLVAGGKVEWLYTPEADVEAVALAPDGRIAAVINRDGFNRLEFLSSDGKPMPLALEPGGVITEIAWSPDGRVLAYAFSTPTAGSRIRLLDVVSGTVRGVMADEPAGRLADALVEPVLVKFPSFDGVPLSGFFYRPRGAPPTRGWPVAMMVHGGPEWQMKAFLRYDVQNLVEAGYAVFTPNVRGSTGYGRRYVGLDDRERRMDSVRDLEVCGHWLRRQPGLDPRRMAILGESYGGFMVLSALSEQPDLWQAGVDVFGVVNFETLLRDTGPWRRDHRAAEYGDPLKDPDLMRWLSPISRAGRIKVPLFVTHGDRDPRVPKNESDQIVAFLKSRGGVVEYQELKYEGHGYLRADNRRAAYDGIRRFLDRHLAKNE
ncbi:MAG: S9 family peptidase [Alphaproteobacteria bacterium]|nr:S9 family peptidase [Alphaproteobacteria bacterium]